MSLFAMSLEGEGSIWENGSVMFNIASPLNDLLEKDSFTLEEVLQEDELIQEVKSRNQKLIDFLCTDECILKMVSYVVNPINPESNDLDKIKYPYMCCEVLCCDVTPITEGVVCSSEGKALEKLFSVLALPVPLDPRKAGYFEKIITLLMIRRPQDVAKLINAESRKIFSDFVKHSGSFSIAEVLKRLLQPPGADFMEDSMDFGMAGMGMMNLGGYSDPSSGFMLGENHFDFTSSQGGGASPVDSLSWLEDSAVVDQLVAMLKPNDGSGKDIDSDVHKHVAEILVDIVHHGLRSQQVETMTTPALVALLERPETIDAIIEAAMPSLTKTSSISNSSMTSALSVLGALLSRHASSNYPNFQEEEKTPVVIRRIVSMLGQLAVTLKAENHDPGTIRTQQGAEVPRLGMRRLKLVGLVVLLMQCKYHAVDSALLEHNIFNICLDLFFQLEAVNLLHTDVESMIITALQHGSKALQSGLVLKANLLERILTAYEDNAEIMNTFPSLAPGFMGHLHRICNLITQVVSDAKESIGETKNSLGDMVHADGTLELFEGSPMWSKWQDFVSTTLAKINAKEELILGGVTIVQPQEEVFDLGEFGKGVGLSTQFSDMLESTGFEDDEDFQTSSLHADYFQDPSPLSEVTMEDSSSSDEEDFPELRADLQAMNIDLPPAPSDQSADWARFDKMATSAKEKDLSSSNK